jgi:hypothetical protein
VLQWTAAVTARDEQLQAARDQLEKLATDRNDAVLKFNALAEKYNASQKRETGAPKPEGQDGKSD